MRHCCHLLLPARCLLLFAICAFPLAFAAAQSTTATLSGTVQDPNNASVPGAHITATNTGTGLKREATTNNSGVFTIPLLPPSTYTVLVESQGFTPAEIKEVILNVGDNVALNIQLKVGQVGATVDVKSDASLISDSPAVGTVVDRQFVANLPLNGRSFQSLINLTPGVVTIGTSFGQQGQFTVNGQRPDTNYFTVDGVSANAGIAAGTPLVQTASGALPATSAQGGTNNLVSIDALQEFRIQTSTFAPEFGRSPGAQVQIVTRPGTNTFTGNVFNYFRNDALDANDWFTNANRLAKPALRQNDFGGVLGGPIMKDRIFFFFSYEGLRLLQPRTVSGSQVPSLATRNAAHPRLRPFLDAFSLPNGPDLRNAAGVLTGLSQFNASFSNPSKLDATSIRVDQTLSSRFTLFGRYNHAPSSTTERGSTGFSLSTLVPREVGTDTLTLGTTWVVSPSQSNEFRFNYSRTSGRTTVVLDDFGGAVPPDTSLFFPSPFSTADALAILIFLNQGQLGVGNNVNNTQRQINVVDNYSITNGAHSLKFGVDYRHLSPNLRPNLYRQVVFFDTAADIAAGTTPFGLVSANEEVDLFYTNFSAYGQDTWKASRRLTLTYGLRWDVNPPPSGAEGREPYAVTGFDNFSMLALAPRGTPLWDTRYKNFSPRFGGAYQLSQKPGLETLIRGGVGIFYDMGTSATGSLAGGGLFPYAATTFVFGVPYPLTAAPPPIVSTPPAGQITVFDPKLKSPRTYQWNVAVEQSLGSSRSLSATYVAAAGRDLIHVRSVDASQATPRNPNFSSFTGLVSNGDRSDYHALQAQFRQRLTAGFQTLTSYTWAHSIDTLSQDISLFDTSARGSSGFDVRHAFNAAVTYNIPTPDLGRVGEAILAGWSVDTTVSVRSGLPVDVSKRYARDPATGNTIFIRPDLVAGVPLYLVDPTAPGGRRINRAAFSAVPADTNGRPLRQGTLGRNVLRGFSFWQVDLALRRQFKLTEKVKLQFRSEFFNIFNHPNFGPPATSLDLPPAFFGVPFSTLGNSLGSSSGAGGGFNPLYQIGGARSTQLAVKLLF